MCPRSPPFAAALLAAATLAGLPACRGGSATPANPPAAPTVSGFAALAARTFAPGPPSGAFLGPVEASTGGTPAFRGQPVGNFAAAVAVGDDELLAVTDDGFGPGASADFLLRLYRLKLDWADGRIVPGPFVALRDPFGHLPFPPASGRIGAPLSGADLGPEGLARAYDGTLWVGEARGPWVLHFSPRGELLERPLPIPVPAAFRAYGRGRADLRSPDHPELAGLDEARRVRGANLPRGGVAGLAIAARGKRAVLALAAPLEDDPERTRVPFLELDVESGTFTGRSWWYRLDAPGHFVGDVAAAGTETLLVVERDDHAGDAAGTKRLYEVRLDRVSEGGRFEKRLAADLLALDDPDGVGPDRGTFRLPARHPDALVVLGGTTVVVLTDDDFPFGRSRGDGAAGTEAVRIELPRPIR